MTTVDRSLKFKRDDGTITFNNKVMVDLSKVAPGAKTKVYSGVASDFTGYETQLVIDDSKFPFDIKISSLSTKGLVMAIVENRLEVDGMVVHDDIQDAYEFLWNHDMFTG